LDSDAFSLGSEAFSLFSGAFCLGSDVFCLSYDGFCLASDGLSWSSDASSLRVSFVCYDLSLAVLPTFCLVPFVSSVFLLTCSLVSELCFDVSFFLSPDLLAIEALASAAFELT
jgi:hypothetical protein